MPLSVDDRIAEALIASDNLINQAFSFGVQGPNGLVIQPMIGYSAISTELRQRIRDNYRAGVAGLLDALTDLEDWIAPTLQNDWVDFGGAYEGVSYRREGSDHVRLRGTAKNGTGSLLFTLPAGNRPLRTHRFTVASGSSTGQVEVTSGGAVTQAAGVTSSLSLDGIWFAIT